MKIDLTWKSNKKSLISIIIVFSLLGLIRFTRALLQKQNEVTENSEIIESYEENQISDDNMFKELFDNKESNQE